MMLELLSNACYLTSNSGTDWLVYRLIVLVTSIQKLLIILDIANPYFFLLTMPNKPSPKTSPEWIRIRENQNREKNWKRWGPYLAERQWGTVREDYSANGDNWNSFTHDQARSRAYRWGEDGLLGITDRQGRACFALALWNHKDCLLYTSPSPRD